MFIGKQFTEVKDTGTIPKVSFPQDPGTSGLSTYPPPILFSVRSVAALVRFPS